MTQRLFIFGMFRSGTTLLARMLDTHKDIVCASDPFRPFYNAFRDSVAAEVDAEVDPYDPLNAYFADEEQLEVYDAVQSTTLDRTFDRDPDELVDRIIGHSKPFSPFIAEELTTDHTSGKTFAEVFEQLLNEVPAQYGTGDEKWIATKEVWTTEFVPALTRSLTNSKFILMVRDPRAVCASKYAQNDKYPWLFLAQQWRKLALLTHLYSTYDGKIANNVLVVRYEDLVTNPKQTAEQMCDFLNIDLDEKILYPGKFTDGRGEAWIQNTSYDDEEPSFNTDSVRKWETQLDEHIIAYIERLCFAEMQLFEYNHTQVTELGYTDKELVEPPRISSNNLAEWILEYTGKETAVKLSSNLGREEIRHRLLRIPDDRFEVLDTDFIRTQFLEAELARDCRNLIKSITQSNQ